MSHFAKTLAGLAKRPRSGRSRPSTNTSSLAELKGFGSNPGALVARTHVPESLSEKAPLVVVLHGCTQSAAGYDTGSGWSRLAEEFGFAVLYPEQQRGNNPNMCFNWFETGDITRGGGEVLSIRQMVGTMVKKHGLDERRIFVTGLSAGGAMALAVLAAYPDVFAGGAIIAGLPYGTAGSVPEAFDRMRGLNMPDTTELQARLEEAVDHAGPWPTISVLAWNGRHHGRALQCPRHHRAMARRSRRRRKSFASGRVRRSCQAGLAGFGRNRQNRVLLRHRDGARNPDRPVQRLRQAGAVHDRCRHLLRPN